MAEGRGGGDSPNRASRHSLTGDPGGDRPEQRVGGTPPQILACLPERLHPVSRRLLESCLAGEMETTEFLRWFHMPNSAYLEVAQCLLRAMQGGA